MSHAALTQRYRPQTFADVAGQSTLKAILSRASAEDKVAPAYLFSGTRGVGKTTIARIFAKALNCKKAPTAEPCNECDNCRAITMGSSVDVVEIDGASNRGIDDVRRLKESVGYAPMDGRYKIFIIDEAHMLSREAFNALLKTLEEPPARVTFVMATTEAHKFPVTILSRCQHYVFKRLSDAELEAHLTKILRLENCPFEANAVRLIVRRAAGSVRDAMSLLGQVLALGGEGLSEADTRMVLGLAGQELFFNLLTLIKHADCPGLSKLVREMLDQGLDLGFFLRELSAMWRNLFLLRQSGEAARSVVDLPEAEVERWLNEAATFDLSHIHAAWQMSLEGQRRVLTSLEPALALELLLLNLAMLPKLLTLDQVSMLSRKLAPELAEKKSPITEAEAENGHTYPELNSGVENTSATNQHTCTSDSSSHSVKQNAKPSDFASEQTITPNKNETEHNSTMSFNAVANTPATTSYTQHILEDAPSFTGTPSANSRPTATPATDKAGHTSSANKGSGPSGGNIEQPEIASAPGNLAGYTAPDTVQAAPPATGGAQAGQARCQPDNGHWAEFVHFCAELSKDSDEIPAIFTPLLNKMQVNWSDSSIDIQPADSFSAEHIKNKANFDLLKKLLLRFCNCNTQINILPPPNRELDKIKLVEHLKNIPSIKALQEKLDAEFVDYGPWRG